MLKIEPHPYQDDAIDRAVGRGSLLIAYEMGLGKTVIAVAAVEELIGEGEVETAVIVVPASLKYQWAQQIAKLTDVTTREISVKVDGEVMKITVPTEDYCIFIEGTAAKRAGQYAKVKANRPDYVIMGYENVVNDWNFVRRIKPQCIVLDEATAIKTFKAQRTRKIKRLTAAYRYALTGTPVENGKPEEIFSIMQWVDDEVLGRFDLYDSTYIVRNGFGGVVRYKNLPVLHARLADAMVRKTRLDPEVAPFLPKEQEDCVEVTLDGKTKVAYKHIAGDLLKELKAAGPTMGDFDLFAHYHGADGPNENTAQGRIMAKMGALDMLLNHPDLIVQSGMNYLDSADQRAAGAVKKNWPGSKYCYELWQGGILDSVEKTPKLDKTIEDIEDILASNPLNKIILFSVNPAMLGFIEERLHPGLCVQYHGGMSAGEKAGSTAKFTQSADCRVFLSSHAGAFGTDLYMANYLINYDLAWSSGKQDQINGRHSRAASEFDRIYIRNMLVKGSTEPRKYQSLAHKRRVGSAITDGHGQDETGRINNDLMTLTDYLESTSV